MIIPEYLKQGDTIAIVATARKISGEEVEPAARLLRKLGFKVKLADNLFNEDHQFSGSDEERANDLMQMVNNPEVRAILCARGGYGTARILDYLDFNAIASNPKWLCGYSDPTTLHLLYNKLGIASIHSTMPINFPKNGDYRASIRSLVNLLCGKNGDIATEHHPLNIAGIAEGELIGGNLSLLYAMQRTPIEVNPQNKILFIEDLDEYLYHIDRMMLNLSQSGVLSKLNGIIVGHLNDMHDNTIPFGKSAEEIVREHTCHLGIPVGFGIPAGHLEPNLALCFGRTYRLEVGATATHLRLL